MDQIDDRAGHPDRAQHIIRPRYVPFNYFYFVFEVFNQVAPGIKFVEDADCITANDERATDVAAEEPQATKHHNLLLFVVSQQLSFSLLLDRSVLRA
jgi:hypothetical protein